MKRGLISAVATLAVLAAGCGGSGDATPVATTEVTMAKSYRFDPEAIRIKAGETVTWTNEDNFTHTVEVEGRDDRKVEPGKSTSVTFTKPGEYEYVCTLHSHDMKGLVIFQ